MEHRREPVELHHKRATNDDVICANHAGLNTFEGAPALPIALEALGIAFGDAQRRKLIGRVWPNIIGNDGDVVRVRVGGSETVAGVTQWAAAVDWVIGSGLPVDTFVQGRYLNIQITADNGRGVAHWSPSISSSRGRALW